MTRNAEAIHAVADWIDANPERYFQPRWATSTACGTAYCIGGTACFLAGGVPMEGLLEGFVRKPNGAATPPGTWAIELLGLTAWDAKHLFDGRWKPAPHLTVAEALHELAEGADLFAVSHPSVRVYANASSVEAEHA